ncbi:MAG: hypothetical protein ABWY22_07650 [Flavobacterium sp.]
MKKLIALFLVATVLSCSSEDQTSQSPDTASNSLSVLDGKLLSFKDDESFIKEYNGLTELKTGTKLQDWISEKGHPSLLNIKKTEEELDNETEASKDYYSDAIKAILNSESKLKIGGKVIWLNDDKLYKLEGSNETKSPEELKLLKKLEIYGRISGKITKKDVTSREIPNANRLKEWSTQYNNGQREKVISIGLFNETIYLNGVVQSTKMFVKVLSLGKYCSVWKCRWNSENNGNVTLGLWFNSNWGNGNFTTQLSDANNSVMIASGYDWSPNFAFDGLPTATVTWVDGYTGITKTWSQQLSWY